MASIPIADVITTERLPIDAQDIVTKVRLVIAGNIGGTREAFYTRGRDDFYKLGDPDTGDSVTTIALPSVYEYQAAEHAVYRAERSFSLPEGLNPFYNPDDPAVPEPSTVTGFSNPGTPSAVRDGDPLTYAAFEGSGQIIYDTSQASCGWRLQYSLVNPGSSPWSANVGALHRHISSGFTVRTTSQRNIQMVTTASIESVTDLYAITLHDARGEDENLGSGWQRNSYYSLRVDAFTDTDARIHQFYPLILNQPLLLDIAKANIRLPAVIPQRVTVTGVVAPDRSHTIVGWPGGDYTGVVAQHQYELGRTIIDFEQAGAPTGLPAEAIEAARERTVAVKSEIQRSGYSLKMGERQ